MYFINNFIKFNPSKNHVKLMRHTPQNSFSKLVLLNERTSTVLGSEKFRYGYQSSEMDNEVKGEGNSYTTEFRQLDPRLGRWLTIDPLVKDFPWQSSYCSMNNNPIYHVDQNGQSGEPTIDKKKKIVTIHSKLYFYGSKANSKLSGEIATGIASQWNGAHAKTTIDGVEYDVKFEISYETVTEEKAKKIAKNNKSLRNNFIRVENGNEGESSFTVTNSKKGGGNSFWFNTDDELGSSTTAAHEYGHGLGLDHDQSQKNNRPNIMIARNTSYGKKYSIKNKNGEQVVNPNSRRVTQKNVADAMKHKGGEIHNIIFKKDGSY